MRTWVLILMIALLPVRMWAADGMAVHMAQEQSLASERSTMGGMPEDCPMMAKADAGHGSHDEQKSTAHCMTCHLCAAAACPPTVVLEQGPAPTGQPGSTTDGFLSAFLAPDLRPPIS